MNFLKVFFVFLLMFVCIISTVAWATTSINDSYTVLAKDKPISIDVANENNNPVDLTGLDYNELLEASNRINFLLMGKAGSLTDTNMVVSYDPDSNNLDIISIPRDTYMGAEGYYGASQKFNSFYLSEGIERVVNNAEMLTGIDINNHIIVNYDSVKQIVDAVGGVEVDVPRRMLYSDPLATPPLYIDLQPGVQVLNGSQALQFLRYRKNNSNTAGYSDGDLGRIKEQQKFMKQLAKKILSSPGSLTDVIDIVVSNVETDLTSSEMLALSKSVYDMSPDTISTNTLPGNPKYINGISFYIFDSNETKNLIESIYKNETPELD